VNHTRNEYGKDSDAILRRSIWRSTAELAQSSARP
jgi:hypothetical protein